MEFRLGQSKAIVAIACKLVVAVWHISTNEEADLHADERSMAASFINLAYKMGTKNLPEGTTAKLLARQELDQLKIGVGLKTIP